MGFWDAICDIGSSLASGIASVVSSIGSTLSSVASGVADAVKTLAPVLTEWAGKISPIAQVICQCIEIVAKLCGILQQDETVEEIGERSLQAEEEGITLESCDNDYNAYMKRLREFEMDPSKAEARPEWEKRLAGSLVVEKGIEELSPNMSTKDIWPLLARCAEFFTSERLTTYAKLAKEQGVPFGETLAKFFSPDENVHVDKKDKDFVYSAEKAFNPSSTTNQMAQAFREVREAVSPDSQK